MATPRTRGRKVQWKKTKIRLTGALSTQKGRFAGAKLRPRQPCKSVVLVILHHVPPFNSGIKRSRNLSRKFNNTESRDPLGKEGRGHRPVHFHAPLNILMVRPLPQHHTTEAFQMATQPGARRRSGTWGCPKPPPLLELITAVWPPK